MQPNEPQISPELVSWAKDITPKIETTESNLKRLRKANFGLMKKRGTGDPNPDKTLRDVSENIRETNTANAAIMGESMADLAKRAKAMGLEKEGKGIEISGDALRRAKMNLPTKLIQE